MARKTLEVEGWITEAATPLGTNLAKTWEEMAHRLLKDYWKHAGTPYRPVHDPSIM